MNAIVVAGAARASTARHVGVPLLVAGVVVTRVQIKHRDFHVNPFREAAHVRYNGDVDWREHITVNPAVLRGKACIRGTRIPVALVLVNLADGLSVEEIVKSYPSPKVTSVQAALAYAAYLAQERVQPLPA